MIIAYAHKAQFQHFSELNTVTKVLEVKLYCEFKLSFQCNQENT